MATSISLAYSGFLDAARIREGLVVASCGLYLPMAVYMSVQSVAGLERPNGCGALNCDVAVIEWGLLRWRGNSQTKSPGEQLASCYADRKLISMLTRVRHNGLLQRIHVSKHSQCGGEEAAPVAAWRENC